MATQTLGDTHTPQHRRTPWTWPGGPRACSVIGTQTGRGRIVMKPCVSSPRARPSAQGHTCSLVHTSTCEYPGEHRHLSTCSATYTHTHAIGAVPPEGSHTSDIHTRAHIPSLSRKLTGIRLLVTLLSKHAYWQPAQARTHAHTGPITSIFAHRDICGQAHTCAHADTHSRTPGTRRCSRSAWRPPAGGHTEVQVGGGDPARDPGSKELVVRVPAPT